MYLVFELELNVGKANYTFKSSDEASKVAATRA